MTAAPVVDRDAMERAKALYAEARGLWAAGRDAEAQAKQRAGTVAWMQALGRQVPARQAVRT